MSTAYIDPKLIAAAKYAKLGLPPIPGTMNPEEKKVRSMVIQVTAPTKVPVVEVKQPEPVAKLKQENWDEDSRMVCPCCTTYVFSLNLGGLTDPDHVRCLTCGTVQELPNPLYEALVTHTESLEKKLKNMRRQVTKLKAQMIATESRPSGRTPKPSSRR